MAKAKTYHRAQYSRANNAEFRRLYEASGLTKKEIAAELKVSEPTVISWTKSEASKASFQCPSWAVDKLRELTTRKIAYEPS